MDSSYRIEINKFCMYSTSHDVDHSLSQELSLSEEVSEVDVENPAGLGDEKVVEVSIADAEDVGHDTIGRCSRERGRKDDESPL